MGLPITCLHNQLTLQLVVVPRVLIVMRHTIALLNGYLSSSGVVNGHFGNASRVYGRNVPLPIRPLLSNEAAPAVAVLNQSSNSAPIAVIRACAYFLWAFPCSRWLSLIVRIVPEHSAWGALSVPRCWLNHIGGASRMYWPSVE